MKIIDQILKWEFDVYLELIIVFDLIVNIQNSVLLEVRKFTKILFGFWFEPLDPHCDLLQVEHLEYKYPLHRWLF